MFFKNITELNNIGEERAKKLNKLGIYNIKDLIEYYPKEYDDRSNIISVAELNSLDNSMYNEVYTIKGKMINKAEYTKIKHTNMIKLNITDGTGVIEIIWFNQPYLINIFNNNNLNNNNLNKEYMFIGKVSKKFNKLQMSSPEYEILDNSDINNNMSSNRIVPIYASINMKTSKISQKIFRIVIKEALDKINQKQELVEIFPIEFMKKNNLCSREYAVRNIHFPENNDAFFQARRRLVFEEFILLQLKLLDIKGNIEDKSSNIKIKDLDTKIIENLLGFELTNAQKNVLLEIKEDLLLDKPMNRLIQGDVGSGKTALAEILSYIGVNNNYQVSIMAPTEVLASQHYKNFKNKFDKLGIRCVFLSGSQKVREKREVYKLIEDGDADIIIGTHAIIQDKVNFKNLGIVITDEQHRFGVKQREKLSLKGLNPHTLVMTATPIPRTLALILYGDLDISIIDELPPNRKQIETIFVNTSYQERIYNFIKKNADEGRQSYIVCPMVEESEKIDLKSVIEYTDKLKNEIFIEINNNNNNKYIIEYIHGKLKNNIKQEIMQRFYAGEIDVLVSTTVIEVGINVPNATIMIIENAERFGISQLHQLRGRVGRGGDKSYCVLISDTKNKDSIKRLKNMVEHSSGFILSEKDLENRGSGDFFGTRQHGVPELKIGNLYKDLDILKEVQEVSLELYNNNTIINNPEYNILKKELKEFFNKESTSNIL